MQINLYMHDPNKMTVYVQPQFYKDLKISVTVITEKQFRFLLKYLQNKLHFKA